MRTISTSPSFKSLTRQIAAILFVSLSLATVATAQTNYRAAGKGNQITLSGTSTLHNWTMTAQSFSCDGRFDVSQANDVTGLSGLSFNLPVHNLKSEHDGMNDNAYEALKADDYKSIVFKLTSAKVNSLGASKAQIVATGNLSIAGVTRSITMNSNASVNTDGTISCTGTVALKLSEFGIERPSFMLGTMKVGDALTLGYNLQLVK